MAVLKLLLVTIFLLLTNFTNGNIISGSSIAANNGDSSSWLSPLGDFAFGFQPLSNTEFFLVAIWFNKIPEKTIVWYANGDNPVPRGSKVEITVNGIVLNDPNGQMVWKQELVDTVSYGAMLDSGNFVLAHNDSNYVWESFSHPTDTILPTQMMELGGKLTSRLTQTNYSKGRFELNLIDGNLELSPVAWPSRFRYNSYFIIRTLNATDATQSGDLYIEKMNGGKFQLSWQNISLNTSDYYYRATLDFYGVFTQYARRKSLDGDQNWSIVHSVPDNICWAIRNDLGSGACGFNSYCQYDFDKPSCKCPNGYVLMDPNNEFGGCKPDFRQGCDEENNESLYETQVLSGVNWPLGDYQRLEPYSQAECESSCLNDCLCAVAIFGSGRCWKKKLPLANGRFEGQISVAIVKVRKRVSTEGRKDPPFSERKKNDQDKVILLGSLCSSIAFNVLLLSAVFVIGFLNRKRSLETTNESSTLLNSNLHMFTYKDLQEATNEFKEELGRGSFGIVYKGILKSNSRSVVAVKMLNKFANERENEFKTEVIAIGKTHHKNLCRLIGFCEEETHRLLVYEFMSNGTLADFLFSLPKPEWNLRVSIALGIARGLVYLHEECDIPIIHCDIKPQNILLDEHFRARISDFGLAKLLLSDKTGTDTLIRGTRGYVAPEWFKAAHVTAKVDVYSFGVMLLEIICCRKSVVGIGEEHEAILSYWVYDCYVEGTLNLLFDMDVSEMDEGVLLRWVKIAIWCVQEDNSKRPTMKMVTEMLEGFVEVPAPPCPFS